MSVNVLHGIITSHLPHLDDQIMGVPVLIRLINRISEINFEYFHFQKCVLL